MARDHSVLPPIPQPCYRASVHDMQRLGWLLREIRQRADMSQDEIARLAGASRSQVSRWENGQHEPSYRKIRKLADALHELDPSLDDLSGELVQAAGYGSADVRDMPPRPRRPLFSDSELAALEKELGVPLDRLDPETRRTWLSLVNATLKKAERDREEYDRQHRRGA